MVKSHYSPRYCKSVEVIISIGYGREGMMSQTLESGNLLLKSDKTFRREKLLDKLYLRGFFLNLRIFSMFSLLFSGIEGFFCCLLCSNGEL